MLNDFAQEKETFLTLKNRIFPKGLTHAFDQKIPISSLVRFDQNKTRNNAQRLCRVKRNLLGYKKQNFSKSKKSNFSEAVNPCF